MNEFLAKGKINLNLKVLSKRPDGYHNIKSVMTELDFGDTLRIKESSCCDSFTCNVKALSRDNLVLKALSLLRDSYRVPPMEIELIKNLPIASGMGGGSSDAATFIMAAKKLFDLPMTRADVFDICRQIGMDVSFFIDGGIQVASERGDVLKKIAGIKRDALVVFNVPSYSKNVYQLMRPDDFNSDSYNDLLAPVLRDNQDLKNFYEYILQFGNFKMTGAGGAFYLIDEVEALREISDKIEASYKQIGSLLVPTGDAYDY